MKCDNNLAKKGGERERNSFELSTSIIGKENIVFFACRKKIKRTSEAERWSEIFNTNTRNNDY